MFSYAGESLRNGNKYDLVFATWKDAKPLKDTDQYLIWINKETGLIDRVEFSVRDVMKWIKGGLDFVDYQDFNGLKLPKSMPVDSPLGKGNMHLMKLSGFCSK